ncbi:MAG: L-rhamnose mutarotase [Firmicutes bacterium]|nr:L-rhamnose mutarotase [Bacillota bacterium]
MERYAWQGKIRDGCLDEYIERHKALWPAMIVELKNAGIVNYSIWTNGTDLFGYYECEKGVQFAVDFQYNSPTVQQWEAYMRDILIMEKNEQTKAQPKLTEVFRLD